ncbi:MAG TPA: hypothetical protein VGJ14_18660 [Sporichthyaceae bacterium]
MPFFGEGDIGFARIVEVQRMRAATEGWDTSPRSGPADDGARFWWQVRRLRQATTRLLPMATGPLVPAPVLAATLGRYWWIAAAAGLAVGMVEALWLTRTPRRLFAVRKQQPRPWRYVRFVDAAGNPGLLLFSHFDDGAPAALLPLPSRTAADGLPVDGVAHVHGSVRAGEAVLPVIGGRAYWPATPAQAVPPAVVRNVLNSHNHTAPRRAA